MTRRQGKSGLVRGESDMKDHPVVMRIEVVTMPPPCGALHVDFHIAAKKNATDPQLCVNKVGPAIGIDHARKDDLYRCTFRGDKQLGGEELALPDITDKLFGNLGDAHSELLCNAGAPAPRRR